MSLVIAEGLSLMLGSRVILDGAAFSIGPTDRVGLVGANGTGKSTLLKILAGQQPVDAGSLTFRRGARLGYLPQDLTALPEGSVLDSVLGAVPGREELERRLVATQAAMEAATAEAEQLELAQLLADLHEELDAFNTRYGPHRARAILSGLGFSTADASRPTAELSGGWRMRAALAGILLADPDLVLLDEPTNHLDVPTLAWFDSFLSRSGKAMVLVSHDRRFLDRHIGRVISLELEGLRSWVGNFEAYQTQRAVEAERLLRESEKVEARRAQLEAFITRFRAKASKARQAQSRAKELARLETVETVQDRDTLSFRFPPAPPSGREVVRLVDVHKAFGPRTVYRGLTAQVLRGERIAVVGLNGTGKTTLLKLVAGELVPDRGQVVLGHQVSLGYYAQHHAETLDGSLSILDTLCQLVPDQPARWVRSVAGAFLFSRDDVDKKVGVLSGGERARVALARLLIRPANLLVMDEPTNHLDLDSSEALIDALTTYEGTVLFVSHNHSFLDALATRVWDVVDGTVVAYPGTLTEYLAQLERRAEQSVAGDGEEPGGPTATRARKDRRAEAEAQRRRKEALAAPKKRLKVVEDAIARLEAEQKEREAQLADPTFAGDFPRARPVMEAHQAAAAELEALYAEWEVLGAQVEGQS